MEAKQLLERYTSNSIVQHILHTLQENKARESHHLKGLVGSLGTVLAASSYRLHPSPQLFVLRDKESAQYFYSDLRNLLSRKEVWLYPASHQTPYTPEKIQNANLLLRNEVLHHLSKLHATPLLVVTYPKAITEKILPKENLTKHTFSLKVGDEVRLQDLQTRLFDDGFDKTDFVYEVGQFSVRGGIIDIFSHANVLPYRIELFGKKIESIRTFDPTDQLSIEEVTEAPILSKISLTQSISKLPFLSLFPPSTKVWIKDEQSIEDSLEEAYQKATESFRALMKKSNQTQIVSPPEHLYLSYKEWLSCLVDFSKVYFGNQCQAKKVVEFDFKAKGQTSFHQDMKLFAEDLDKHKNEGFVNILATKSKKQGIQITQILEEHQTEFSIDLLSTGLSEGFIDPETKTALYTDHQFFDRYYAPQSPKKYSASKSLTLKDLQTLQPGDYVVHVDHGIGKFAGLHKVTLQEKQQEVLKLLYKDNDTVYVNLHGLHKISKYTGAEGKPPTINKLGANAWHNKKASVKKKVKDIAKDLISLYSKRKKARGFAFQSDSTLQIAMESSFMYEDTPDQGSATADVKKDMETPHPMDRLVCGDVGFGKTEVAMRAAFKAVDNGKQVAVLVPTTILALQHFHSFQKRIKNFPIKIAYINRFKSTKAINETLEATARGEIDILIGTHRILNKAVQFKDLGLLVVDEEQKFGVKAKERLKEMKVSVDILTLTATPIPRTLHFSLMGARDLSIIATPPPNRKPVSTTIHTFNDEVIRDAINHELQREGQVFFVHNRVAKLDELANTIQKLVPDCRIGIAHGQMKGDELERKMMKFIDGEYDVLVSTNIIESGLDIPNVNTIIIHSAHMFGLADLHQMRGRVGRSNRKAYCYLLTPPMTKITENARKRLSVLEEFSHLGDGFKVAMRDLDIRGAGNLLGAEQSGFVADLGFDMYHKILDDAVQELKEEEFKDLFKEELTEQAHKLHIDCAIETDFEILIPESYVNSSSERVNLYVKLDHLKDEAALATFQKNLKDRFGTPPKAVDALIEAVRLRWQATTLGFTKIRLKNSTMKCYFVDSKHTSFFQSPTFSQILAFIQQKPQTCSLKEIKQKLILTIQDIHNIEEAKKVITEMTKKKP